jgi:undecaprenyl phosphate-alpha-L-ara4N flippase subunit ArnE
MLRWLVLSVALLGCAMLLWLLVLQRVPVSVAYPMLSLNFIFITLAARFIWHEPVSLRHWLGVGLIIGGIVMMVGAA